MEPFRWHVFACNQPKPEGAPGCMARGAAKTIEALQRELATRGLADEVQVTTCGSVGLCTRGPNVIVYPDGVWYSGVTAEDVPEIVESHFQNGKPVARLLNADREALTAEIRTNRERFLAGVRARDAAGVLPDDVMQMINGFRESRALLTGIELDVFTTVGEGRSAAEVAKAIGTDVRGTEALLNAVAALGLLAKSGDVFKVTPVSKRYFTAGGQNDARAATMHIAGLWHRWSALTEAVREGRPVAARERDEDSTRWFIAAMHRNAADRARAVADAVGAAGVTRLLDVGGGSGAYSIAFAQANANLRAEVLDLESVLPLTRGYIEEAGVGSRVTVRPGDLRRDELGSGYDLVLVSAICHMLGPDENRDLLRRCAAALVPGGRVVVQDFILESDKTAPKTGALFSLNMLVGTERGASYSEDEYRAWMSEGGLEEIERVRLTGPTNLMIGSGA